MRRIVCPARRHQNPAAQQKDTLTAREKGAHAARRRGAGTAAAQRRFPVPGLAATGPGGLGHRRSPCRAARRRRRSWGCIQPLCPAVSLGSALLLDVPKGGCTGGEAAGVQDAQDLRWCTHSRVPSSHTPRRRRARVPSMSRTGPTQPQKGHAVPSPSPPAAEAKASCCCAAPSGHCPAGGARDDPKPCPPITQLRSGHRQLWRWTELSPPWGQLEQDNAVLPTVRHAPGPSFLATLRPWRCAARGHAPVAPPQAAPEETGWEKLHLDGEPLLFPL